MDGLLDSSVVLENHRSCSNWTFASMACALGGSYNTEQAFMPIANAENVLPRGIDTMAELLGREGFATALISATRLSDPSMGLFRGYDRVTNNLDAATFDLLDDIEAQSDYLLSTGAPWLLHVHVVEPHFPYDAPSSYQDATVVFPDTGYDLADPMDLDRLEREWSALTLDQQDRLRQAAALLYDAEARYLDDGLQSLFGMLEDKGMLEDTLVVLMSDHGEQLLEHDDLEHGWSLYGEETRAFAAFSAPGLQAKAVTESTTHADILPTLLGLMGMEIPPGVTGADAIELDSPRPIFAAMAGTHVGVAQSVDLGSDRLIYNWETGQVSLFDLDTDPGEFHDLADDEPELVESLLQVLTPQIDAMAPLVHSLYND
jgi:arylsulfatase A-like enzyme